MRLYEYINYELVQMNMTKDVTKSVSVLNVLGELKEAWLGVKAANSKTYIAED